VIIRVVGQNGGGSRVYVHQLNDELSKKGTNVATFYKEYKDSDPLTSFPSRGGEHFYSINIFKILLFTLKNRKKIEYVHSHLRNATVICYVICWLLKLKHVITVHGPISYGKKTLKDKIIINLFGRALKSSTVALFISNFTLENTLNICKIKKCSHFKVIYNGSEKVLPSVGKESNQNLFRIAVVGELTERKRPLEIIELCKALTRDSELKKMFHIDIYGDGHLKNELLNEIARFDLEDNISVHGNIYDLNVIYSNANLHLIFAYDEGFGRVITESMAYGIPSLAFNSGAFPEIIEHGKSGFLFDSTSDCIEIIKDLLLGKTLQPSKDDMRAYFIENFSSEIFKEKTFRIINEALV
jgi:glycosyltransferase involved in cell wall biosynthesis